jgi:hypothetical protein
MAVSYKKVLSEIRISNQDHQHFASDSSKKRDDVKFIVPYARNQKIVHTTKEITEL